MSHEGRAQRYFAVLPARADVRPAWRWLRELLVRLGRREARGWRTPDDVLAALEMELPAFARRARRRAGRLLAPRRPQGRPPAAALERAHGPGRGPHRLRARPGARPGLGAGPLARGPAAAAVAGRAPGPHLVAGLELQQRPAQVRRGARGGAARRSPPASACSTAPPPAASCRRSGAAAVRGARRRAAARPAAPHLRLGAAQHVHAGHRASARRRPSSASTRRTPSGSPCARATAGALAAVDGRARALRAGAVAGDGHGRGARGPPRPPLHLVAGARAPRARGGAVVSAVIAASRAPSVRWAPPPAPPPGTGSC